MAGVAAGADQLAVTLAGGQHPLRRPGRRVVVQRHLDVIFGAEPVVHVVGRGLGDQHFDAQPLGPVEELAGRLLISRHVADAIGDQLQPAGRGHFPLDLLATSSLMLLSKTRLEPGLSRWPG